MINNNDRLCRDSFSQLPQESCNVIGRSSLSGAGLPRLRGLCSVGVEVLERMRLKTGDGMSLTNGIDAGLNCFAQGFGLLKHQTTLRFL